MILPRFFTLLFFSALSAFAQNFQRLSLSEPVSRQDLEAALDSVAHKIGYRLGPSRPLQEGWALSAPLLAGYNPELVLTLEDASAGESRDVLVETRSTDNVGIVKARRDFLIQAIEQELSAVPQGGRFVPLLRPDTYIAMAALAPYAAPLYAKDRVLLDAPSLYFVPALQLLYEVSAWFLIAYGDSPFERGLGIFGLASNRGLSWIIYPEFKRVNAALIESGYSFDPRKEYPSR